MQKFTIWENEYLKKRTKGYYNRNYYGFKKEDNPDFLNDLKNTFAKDDKYTLNCLTEARQIVIDILHEDIPKILIEEKWDSCICVCVPRAKANLKYEQMFFRYAVSLSCESIKNVINGAFVIKRVKDTKTTHLANSLLENNGSMPYPGIVHDTCIIDSQKVLGKQVILIDDIYTRNCNIDEDCIQALYDVGAKEIVFYAIAHTKRREE